MMRLRGLLGEAWRNVTSGTTHALLYALCLAAVTGLLCGADALTILDIHHEADRFVASGGSTYRITQQGGIDPAACESLTSARGVCAAGAIRQTEQKTTFAVLPSTAVPTYEVTPGALAVFAEAADGVPSDSSADPSAGSTSGLAEQTDQAGGLWLSHEAAAPLHARAGSVAALRDGRSATIGGVFDWPDDGRDSEFTYTALAPVPVVQGERFDSCIVRAWPVPRDMTALLRLAAAPGSAGGSAGAGNQPTITQLNTSHGTAFDAQALYNQRLTRWAPAVAAVAGLLLVMAAVWFRRLELASNLHCGVPKTAMVTQALVESLVWVAAALLLTVPVIAWFCHSAAYGDLKALLGTLLRIPGAGAAGSVTGTLLAALWIRERRLFAYFKAR